MHSSSRAGHIGFWLCLALLLYAPSLATGADVDVMLELVSNLVDVESKYPGWSAANFVNYCTWTGVTCDSNARVTSIDLAWEKGKTISGSIPASITALTELTSFGMTQHLVIGDIPPALFQLPKIVSVGLANTGVNIVWPATFSPTLRSLNLIGANISAPLPANLPWDNMWHFAAWRSGVTCPFPSSALSFLQNDQIECNLLENPLSLENGKVCGQIPVENMRCGFSPRLIPPTDFTTTTNPPKPTHVVTKAGFQIEIVGDQIMFFATRNVSGKLEPFRDEYLSFTQNPWFVGKDSGFENPQTFPLGPFKPEIRWVSDNEFRVNATMLNGVFETEWRFIFGANAGTLKFSVACFRLQPYTWPANYTTVTLPMTLVFNVPHSGITGSSIKCDNLNRFCNSSVLSLLYEVNVLDRTFVSTLTSSKLEVIFSYGTVGTLDGADMTPQNTRVDVNRYYYPIASDDFFESYQKVEPETNFPGGPLNRQFFATFMHVSSDLFSESMIYDPDISIRLLFDSGEASPDEKQAAEVGMGVAATVAIAVTVSVVILAAGVTAFKFVIWPRLAHESASKPLASSGPSDAELTESPPPARESRTGWQAGHTTHARLTNQ